MSDESFSHFVKQLEKMSNEIKTKPIRINAKDNAKWWYKLSLEDKHQAFYAVVSTMLKAETTSRKTYRNSLYEVFKFGPEMYDAGVQCGYKELHKMLEKDKTFDDVDEIRIQDSNGIFNLDLSVSEFSFTKEDNGYGSKTLILKIKTDKEE